MKQRDSDTTTNRLLLQMTSITDIPIERFAKFQTGFGSDLVIIMPCSRH